jgi:hypothetical protein
MDRLKILKIEWIPSETFPLAASVRFLTEKEMNKIIRWKLSCSRNEGRYQ